MVAVFCLVHRLPEYGILSCLTQSSNRNGGIVRISDCRPLKSIVGSVTRRNIRETESLWALGARNCRKTNRVEYPRPWEEAGMRHVAILRHLNTALYEGNMGKMCMHRPREDICPENSWEDFKSLCQSD